MEAHKFELSVGDVLTVGDYMVTVIDIDGDYVSLRIDSDSNDEPALMGESHLVRPR